MICKTINCNAYPVLGNDSWC